MNDAKHKLERMMETLEARDKNAVADMTRLFGPGPGIEQRLQLADGRAMDALKAILIIAEYIIEKEKAGSASNQVRGR